MVPSMFFAQRYWLLALAMLGCLFPQDTAASSYGDATADHTQNAPNIIFILADDLGIGDIGCYGQKILRTPNIDSLSAQGVRFTNVRAGASVCAPSRCVLMTGLHTGHSRVRGNAGMVGGVGKERRVPLTKEDVTIAKLLQAQGYVTGMAGKWGLGEPGTDGEPQHQGFSEWYGYLNQNHAAEYFTDHLWSQNGKVEIPENAGNSRVVYSQDLIAAWSIDFIKRHKDQRFFLYLPWTLPHANFEIAELGRYANQDWPNETKSYAAMVEKLDADIGRVLVELRNQQIDSNTLILFASDNGSADRRDSTLVSIGKMRGKKGTPYEGGLRVPMMACWPGKIEPGRLSDASWNFVDVLPTLCDVASIEAPPALDGISVLGTLLGNEQTELRDRIQYWEQHQKEFVQAVVWNHWKAINWPITGKIELFDLSKDPEEKESMASTQPAIANAMKDYLRRARWKSENWPTPFDNAR